MEAKHTCGDERALLRQYFRKRCEKCAARQKTRLPFFAGKRYHRDGLSFITRSTGKPGRAVGLRRVLLRAHSIHHCTMYKVEAARGSSRASLFAARRGEPINLNIFASFLRNAAPEPRESQAATRDAMLLSIFFSPFCVCCVFYARQHRTLAVVQCSECGLAVVSARLVFHLRDYAESLASAVEFLVLVFLETKISTLPSNVYRPAVLENHSRLTCRFCLRLARRESRKRRVMFAVIR